MSILENMDPRQREALLREFIEKYNKKINVAALQYGDQLTALAVTVLRHRPPRPPSKPKELPASPRSKIRRTLELLNRNLPTQYGILDHIGVIKARIGKEPIKRALVSEPYGPLSIKGIELLVKTCRENNLEFWIDGASYHFPGKTMRIVIYPSERNVENNVGVG